LALCQPVSSAALCFLCAMASRRRSAFSGMLAERVAVSDIAPQVDDQEFDHTTKPVQKVAQKMSLPRWKIVGGQWTNGLLVRSGRELSSEALQGRLATGSVVEQLELEGDRLHYYRVNGSGPKQGWITTALNDRVLAEPLDEMPTLLTQMHSRSEYMTQPHSGGRGMPPGNLLGGPPGNLGPYPYGMSGPMPNLGGQMLGSSPLPVGPQSGLDLPDPRRYPRGRMLDDGFDGRMPPHMMDPYMQDPYMPMPGGMPPGASKAYMDRMAGMVDGPPPLYAGGPAPYAEY